MAMGPAGREEELDGGMLRKLKFPYQDGHGARRPGGRA